ncbi:hypothetical protein OLY84_07430, partial [Brachybacterium squillarum]|nr:hypothetical protein [Brachybacterium squillarum]
PAGESSAAIAHRVAAARERQRRRFADRPWHLNCQIPGPDLRRDLAPEPSPSRASPSRSPRSPRSSPWTGR